MDNLQILHKLAATQFNGKRNLDDASEADAQKNLDLGAESRRKAGCYTLEEAAIYIATHASVTLGRIYHRLEKAISDGSLKVYRAGEDISYNIKEEFVNYPWSDEIFWNTLNDWLEENAPRIGHIFPNPDTSTDDATIKIMQAATHGNDEPGNNNGDWTIKAQAIAQRLGEMRLKKTGARQINATNICDEVANELALDPTTHGRQGPRSLYNVRNVGLKGWKFIPQQQAENVV